MNKYQKGCYIFTGPNFAGKTTLIRQIMAKYDFRMMYKGIKEASDQLAVYRCFEATGAWFHQYESVIIDRLPFPDDLIYKAVYGERNKYLEEAAEKIVYNIVASNGIIFYIRADLDVLEKRFQEHWHVNKNQLASILQTYDETIEALRKQYPKLRIVEIDTSYTDAETIFSRFEERFLK